MTRSRSSRLAIIVAVGALLASCHGGGEAPTPAPPTTSATLTPTPAVPLGTTAWLVALRVARDPNDLDADARSVLAAVDGSTVVTPASCFRGLPAGPAPSDYVLGVVAATRSEAERLAATTGLPAVFTAHVRLRCTD